MDDISPSACSRLESKCGGCKAKWDQFLLDREPETYELQPDKVPYYRLKRPKYLRIDPCKGVYFYRLNVERKPLDNPKVRMALNLAVDREAIVKNVTRQNEQPATSSRRPEWEIIRPSK